MNASPLPPLKDRVEAVLQCLAKDDPLLRKALDRRCDRKVDCVRGPFGCVCEVPDVLLTEMEKAGRPAKTTGLA